MPVEYPDGDNTGSGAVCKTFKVLGTLISGSPIPHHSKHIKIYPHSTLNVAFAIKKIENIFVILIF